MKLLEALKIINEPPDDAQPTRHYVLATGFTPLALESFLHAHLRERARPHNVRVSSGRFGDLPGNLERAAAERADGVAVVVEWSDIDARLGLRGHGAVVGEAAEDVLTSSELMLDRLAQRIGALARVSPIAVCLPTLPMPHYFHDLPGVRGRARLRLDVALARFAADVAGLPRVRVVDGGRLDVSSPVQARSDPGAELSTGFPYARVHAERVADSLASALRPPAPKKGLITDLDDTLWRGILGEVGVSGVHWALDAGSHVHALYQQCLANLLESGVLVAVASKNEAALVGEALQRDDLVVAASRLYPVHANWGPKSASVRAILSTWNVGADSVVFVDDSPLELAEVHAAFPDVECIQFRPDSPAAIVDLLRQIAELFGREEIREEDRLRAESIRQSAAVREAVATGGDTDDFLRDLGAEIEIVLSRDVDDARALELVNKTNQFNLNGDRYGDTEWRDALERAGAFLLTVSYRDKFGPLGKIGVMTGVVADGELRVDSWVLSCRAFARRIEHATLNAIFETFPVSALTLGVRLTPRNGPTQELVAALTGADARDGDVRLTRAEFEEVKPPLFATVVVRIDAVLAADLSLAATSSD